MFSILLVWVDALEEWLSVLFHCLHVLNPIEEVGISMDVKNEI